MTSHSAKPGDLTLSKTVFAPGEAAIATLTGFGAGEIQDTAYAGIFQPSDLLEKSPYGASTYISSLRDGKTANIKVFATRRPGGSKTDAIKMVTLGSLDGSVAVVNSAGVVKGVGRGTTYIKVSYGKVIAKIKVKVS